MCGTFIPISEMQKGFRPVNGLGMNVRLLQAIVSERANFSQPMPLTMCYVDVKKAFNSVIHDTILKALESAGAPASFVNYFRNLYKYSNTQISVNG